MNATSSVAAEPGPTPSLPPAVAAALEAKIHAHQLTLPLLPAVPMEVSRIAGSENSDARKIAELIQRDQAMAAHLLKLANSPLYRGKVPMVTVQQAVARLGGTRIREAAMMIACQAGVFKVRGFEAEVAAQFRHSIATALFAQEIARQRRANVEEAFLSGLMHDVGRPVLLQALLDLSQELQCPLERPAILAAIGEHHAYVGGELGREWDLSARVSDAMEQHHDDDPLPSCAELVHTVQLADALAHHAFEPEAHPLATLSEHPALGALEIYPDTLSTILSRSEDIQATAKAIG